MSLTGRAASGMVAVAAIAGVAVATHDSGTRQPAVIAHGYLPDTATVNVCESDDSGYVRAAGTVNNPSPSLSDYEVLLTMRDTDGALVGTQTVAVVGVPPGRAAGWDTPTQAAWGDDVHCSVTVSATGRAVVNH